MSIHIFSSLIKILNSKQSCVKIIPNHLISQIWLTVINITFYLHYLNHLHYVLFVFLIKFLFFSCMEGENFHINWTLELEKTFYYLLGQITQRRAFL
jgi:hypothetical protein